MMFLKFKNSCCNHIFSLDKITYIKNIGIPYTLGKCNHFIEFDKDNSFEISDDDYNNLIRFLSENNLIVEIV